MTARLVGRRPVWLSVAEASEASGVPARTLRDWWHTGKLRGRRVGKGRGRVQLLASDVEKVRRDG